MEKVDKAKSTLFKIITGVYQPTEGKVVIECHRLQELDINSYWKNTGYVMQRTQFFNDTVRRNMGLLLFSEEEMDTVAKCLDLYDEIHYFRNGMGYRELKLEPCNFSEGQMRRFGYYEEYLRKNSQILIFDEATANIEVLN